MRALLTTSGRCSSRDVAMAVRVDHVLIRNKSSAGTHRPRRQIFLAVNSSVLRKSPDVISVSIGRRLMDSFSAVSLVAVGDVGLELEASVPVPDRSVRMAESAAPSVRVRRRCCRMRTSTVSAATHRRRAAASQPQPPRRRRRAAE
jgi:hypothetical protein